MSNKTNKTNKAKASNVNETSTTNPPVVVEQQTTTIPVVDENKHTEIVLFPKSSRKLSHDIAMSILQDLRAGVKASILAKQYSVDSSTISDIKVGRLYKKALEQFKAMVMAEESKDVQTS